MNCKGKTYQETRQAHPSVTITLDTYPHVLPNMQDELTVAVENILKRD